MLKYPYDSAYICVMLYASLYDTALEEGKQLLSVVVCVNVMVCLLDP